MAGIRDQSGIVRVFNSRRIQCQVELRLNRGVNYSRSDHLKTFAALGFMERRKGLLTGVTSP